MKTIPSVALRCAMYLGQATLPPGFYMAFPNQNPHEENILRFAIPDSHWGKPEDPSKADRYDGWINYDPSQSDINSHQEETVDITIYPGTFHSLTRQVDLLHSRSHTVTPYKWLQVPHGITGPRMGLTCAQLSPQHLPHVVTQMLGEINAVLEIVATQTSVKTI